MDFNIWNIIIGMAVVAAIGAAVFFLIRNKRQHKGCCGECSKCSGCRR